MVGTLRFAHPDDHRFATTKFATSNPAVDETAVTTAPRHVDDRDRPAPVLEQRQRCQVEGRVAEAEQRAIEQRRLPSGALPAADEDHVPTT